MKYVGLIADEGKLKYLYLRSDRGEVCWTAESNWIKRQGIRVQEGKSTDLFPDDTLVVPVEYLT
jgi:hypothetical protein